jgi:hypothetical protein
VRRAGLHVNGNVARLRHLQQRPERLVVEEATRRVSVDHRPDESLIEAGLELGERSVYLRRRQGGKRAEAIGMRGNGGRCALISSTSAFVTSLAASLSYSAAPSASSAWPYRGCRQYMRNMRGTPTGWHLTPPLVGYNGSITAIKR